MRQIRHRRRAESIQIIMCIRKALLLCQHVHRSVSVVVVHCRLTVLGHLCHLQLADRSGAPNRLTAVQTGLVPQIEERIQASAVQQDVAAALLQTNTPQSESDPRNKKE